MPKSSRSEWVATVEALERSGETVAVYARAHGLSSKTLGWWRWRLRKEMEAAEATHASIQAPFLPVVVKSEPARGGTLGLVEAALPNGVVLRWEHRLDLAGLVDLARAFSEVRS